jgi:hypothetical protein
MCNSTLVYAAHVHQDNLKLYPPVKYVYTVIPLVSMVDLLTLTNVRAIAKLHGLAVGDGQPPVASSPSHRDNTFSPAQGSSAQSDNAAKYGTSQVLSPNLHFILYHGLILNDD